MTHRFVFSSGTVSSGQTLSGVTLPSNDTLTVENGGTLLDATITTLTDTVLVHGAAIGTNLEGGYIYVESGGTATSTQAMGGLIEVLAGGAVSNDTIFSGGFEYDYESGTDTNTTIMAGGGLAVEGGVESSVILEPGGELTALNSGLLAGTTLQGAVQFSISAVGLVMSGDVVGSGALVAVFPGLATQPTASATEFTAGATLLEVGGATLSGATIEAGAHLVKADVVLSGSSHQVLAAGIDLSGTILNSGTYETVYSGGLASNTLVNSDQLIESGGTAIGTKVNIGAHGGYDGGQGVEGTAISTTLQNGGGQFVEQSGAVARFTLVESGGVQTVEAGTSFAATVLAGGVDAVDFSGVAINTVISGGYQSVEDRAKSIGTQILSDGVQTVSGNSIAVGTIISAGAEQDLDGIRQGVEMAEASGTIIQSGGLQVIKGTTIAMSSVVMNGGLQNVELGTASGTVIDSGGELRLHSAVDSVAAAADVTIHLGGTLDYANIAFVSGATATVTSNNVLMVHDGGTTLVLQLVGTYTGDQFHVSKDNAGGTFVTLSAASDTQTLAAASGDMLANSPIVTSAAPAATIAVLPAADQPHALVDAEPIFPLQHV